MRAHSVTRSPLASSTESSFKATLPPIPRNRLPLTPVIEPRALVPAGMTVKPSRFTSLTTTKSRLSPTRAWAEETFSASRSVTAVPSGMISLPGIALLSWPETQDTNNMVSKMYAGILRSCALNNKRRLCWRTSLVVTRDGQNA